MRSSVAGLVATIALTLTACTNPAPEADRWQPVYLPGAGRVVTLTGADDGLLVGRYDDSAQERASLTVVGPDGSSRPVAMETRWEWAGREAELLSVSEREGEVVAVGGHRAGAHGNVRWTVWSGDLDEVVEQPQRFEVFGGWDAGGLTGTALSQGGPVILGSWAARSRQGLDVAVWTRDGDRWSRPARPGTPLAASATRQPSPGAVTDLPDGDLLAVGWVTVLGDRIRDEAVVWTAADPAGPWREVSLPSTGGGTQRPMGVDCAADHCVVAGSSDTDVVLWRVDLTDDGLAPTRPRTALPDAVHSPAPMIRTAAGAVDTVAHSEPARGEQPGTTRVVRADADVEELSVTGLPGRLAAMANEPRGAVVVATTTADRTRAWRHDP